MPTILVSLPLGMSARNILRSRAFGLLREKATLHILTPLHQDPSFLKEFNHPDVQFSPYPSSRTLFCSLIDKILLPLQLYWLTKKHPIKSLVLLKKKFGEERPAMAVFCFILSETIGRISLFVRFMEWAHAFFLRTKKLKSFFDQHHVDLVFLTHGYILDEIALASEAKRRGVNVINMIHSWDNVSSKSGLSQFTNPHFGRLLPVRLIDHHIVWNEILSGQLQDLYGVNPSHISICGIPQFDDYPAIKLDAKRGPFLESLGLNPQKKTLLYLAASPSINRNQTKILDGLVHALRQKKFFQACQLLIRFHPGTEMKNWINLFSGPDVYFQRPHTSDKALSLKDGWQLISNDKQSDLARTISHCDILINCASTTAIEGAVFDKPIIGIGFDGDSEHTQVVVDHYYSTTHYSNLMKTNGVSFVKNTGELVDAINGYLKDPNKDASGRESIRIQQCYKLDGKSGQRIAECIIGWL